MSAKQQPANEVEVFDDDSSLDKVARAMPSPCAKSPVARSPTSVWEQWVSTQVAVADNALSEMERAEQRKVRSRSTRSSARSDLSTSRIDNKLVPGSPNGSTNTGRTATQSRLHLLADSAQKEQDEVRELQQLLGRTLYTGGAQKFKRAGNVATASLMKLSDGQHDDIISLRKQRVAEEEAAVAATGKPPWNSSPYRRTPSALRGIVPVTNEPWARDAAMYEDSLSGHGFKSIGTGADDVGHKNGRGGKKVSIESRNVAGQIERDMAAYRHELGEEKKAPPSARHLRAWSDAGSMPPSARTTGRSTWTGRKGCAMSP